MIPILFPESETAFTGAGLGALAGCISCDVKEALNDEFVCEFQYPVDGPMYNIIQPGKIVLCTYDTSGATEPFDIYAREINIDGVATFRANHMSYRLNTLLWDKRNPIVGGFTGGSSSQSIQYMLSVNANYLNRLLYGSLSFSQNGYNIGADSNVIIYPKKVMSLREIILSGENSIVGQTGAEIKWSKQGCTFYRRRGVDTTAIIRYSSNMTGMSYEYDRSGVCMAVIPYWVNSDGTTYYMPNLNSDATSYPSGAIAAPSPGTLVYSAESKFTAAPLDVSSYFSEQPTADAVYDFACEYHEANSIGRAYENLTIDFQPLWDQPEYQYIAPSEKLTMGDVATVVFPEYGLIKPLKVVKTQWDMLNERYTRLEFGTAQRTIYNVNMAGGAGYVNPNAGRVVGN